MATAISYYDAQRMVLTFIVSDVLGSSSSTPSETHETVNLPVG